MGSTHLWVAILLFGTTVGSWLGCSRDPNVRKRGYFESGNRYYEKGQYREAVIQYSNALQVDERFAEAHYRLALAYEKLREWTTAYSELSRAVELQPHNLKAQLELGTMLLAEDQLVAVQEKADLVLREDPDNADGHQLLANLYAAQGKSEDALKEMGKVVTLAPDRSSSYINLGLLELNGKKPAEAETNLRKAVELDPKSSAPLLALSSLLQQTPRWSEAEQQLLRAIEVDPNSSSPRAALARLYMAQSMRPRAEQVLIQAKKDLSEDPAAYRMLGDYYLEIRDTSKAFTEFASLRQEHPKDREVRDSYVQLLLMNGRIDEAEKLNNEIKKNKNDADSLIVEGQILLQRGRSSDAADTLQAAIRSTPDNALAHYLLGLALDAVGFPERAETEWQQAVQLEPGLAEAWEALASMALRRNDYPTLTEIANQLIRLQPANSDGYVLRATGEFGEGQMADGENDTNKALQLAPQSPAPHVLMGNVQLQQRRFKQAEQSFEQALARDPNSAESLRGLVSVYLAQNQPDKALARVDMQIAKVHDNAAYLYFRGMLLVKRKELQAGEKELRKAVELNKNNYDAIAALGQVEIARGFTEQAIVDYRQAIQQSPRETRFYILLGMLLESKGEWQEAQATYEQALQVDPRYAPAANNLAYLMLERGENTDVALSLAQAARRAVPESASVEDTLGWAYYHKGAYDMAIDLLEEAEKKAPENPDLQFHLGLAYQKNKNAHKARIHLEKALQLNPALSEAQEARKALAELEQS